MSRIVKGICGERTKRPVEKEISTREWQATSNRAAKSRNPRAGTSWVK